MSRCLVVLGACALVSCHDRGKTSEERMTAKVFPLELGTPRAIDAPVPSLGSSGDQDQLAIAFNGTSYLMVWADRRGTKRQGDIFAARLDANGAPLDGAGFPVCLFPGEQSDPRVVADGPAGWVVTWIDDRTWPREVFGARITLAGQVSDPDGIQLTPAAGGRVWSHDLGSDGTTPFLVWGNDASDVLGVHLDPSLGVVEPTPLALAATALAEGNPSIAFSSAGQYLVAWEEVGANTNLYAKRFNTNGTPIDAAKLRLTSAPQNQVEPMVAGGPSDYAIGWTDLAPEGLVYSNGVSTTGTIATASGTLTGNPISEDLHPRVAPVSGGFLLTFSQAYGRSLASRRLSNTATPMGTVTTLVNVPLFIVGNALVCAPTVCLTGWAEAFDGNSPWELFYRGEDLRMLRVDPATGTALNAPGTSPITTLNGEWAPAASFNGTHWFVVWEDDRAGDLDIYGTRVDTTGSVVDPPRLIAGGVGHQRQPAIDGLNGSWLVVWTNGRHLPLSAKRIAASGLDIDSVPLVLGTETTLSQYINYPTVAHDPTPQWLVVVESSGNLFGIRVSPATGVVDNPPRPLVSTANPEGNPTLAFAGSRYLLVFSDSGANGLISGSWVTPALTATAKFTIASRPGPQVVPSLATNGTDFFTTWIDADTTQVLYRRVNGSGGMLDPSPVVLFEGRETQIVRATHDGTNYLVTWDGAPVAASIFDVSVHGARITSGGAVTFLDGGLPQTSRPEVNPTPTPGAPGRLLIAYTERDPIQHTSRVMIQTYANVVQGPCTRPSECVSGYCVDGVCCDSACGGGVTTDCLTCTIAAGGTANGTCTTITTGPVCGPDSGPPDSGPPDSGPPDSGPPDSGPPDSGPPDSGPPDSGPPDSGPPDSGPPDSGPPDSGPPDSGPPDSGPPDSGPPDSGPPDSGPPDSGRPDSGPPDSGPPDSGPPDGGPPDSGPPDSGPPDSGPDAGPPDSGPPDSGPPDSGSSERPDGVQTDYLVGCDCSSASQAVFLPLILAWRYRRKVRRL